MEYGWKKIAETWWTWQWRDLRLDLAGPGEEDAYAARSMRPWPSENAYGATKREALAALANACRLKAAEYAMVASVADKAADEMSLYGVDE